MPLVKRKIRQEIHPAFGVVEAEHLQYIAPSDVAANDVVVKADTEEQAAEVEALDAQDEVELVRPVRAAAGDRTPRVRKPAPKPAPRRRRQPAPEE